MVKSICLVWIILPHIFATSKFLLTSTSWCYGWCLETDLRIIQEFGLRTWTAVLPTVNSLVFIFWSEQQAREMWFFEWVWLGRSRTVVTFHKSSITEVLTTVQSFRSSSFHLLLPGKVQTSNYYLAGLSPLTSCPPYFCQNTWLEHKLDSFFNSSEIVRCLCSVSPLAHRSKLKLFIPTFWK